MEKEMLRSSSSGTKISPLLSPRELSPKNRVVNIDGHEVEIPNSPPSGSLITRSPKTRRGLRRLGSSQDINLSVTDKWDLSPTIRRNSMVFTKLDSPRVSLRESLRKEREQSKLEELSHSLSPRTLDGSSSNQSSFDKLPLHYLEKSNSLNELQFKLDSPRDATIKTAELTIQEEEEKMLQGEVRTLEDISREAVLAAADGEEAYGWKLTSFEEEIWTFRLQNNDSNIDAFKTQTVVNCSPKNFMNVAKNWQESNQWDPWINDVQLKEVVDDNCCIYYFNYFGTTQGKQRDYCVLAAHGVTDEEVEVLSIISVEHKDVPPKREYVRGEIMWRGFVVKPVPYEPNKAIAIHVAQYDPKGDDLTKEQRDFIAQQNGQCLKHIEQLAIKKRMEKFNRK